MSAYKVVVLFCLTFFFTSTLRAKQEASSFDSVFNHVVLNVISKDVVKARHITDSLLKNSVDGRQRIKALMLLANLSILSNFHDDALAYALRAEAIAKEKKDYEWQVRTSGFLSSIFRDANLIAKAREHLKVVESASKRLTSSIDYDLILINLHHEKGHLEFKGDHYRRSIEEFESAQKYIPLLAERLQDGYYSSNYLMLGENYLALKDYDQSMEYFHLALKNKVPNENLNYSSIYRGLGDIELQNKNYEQAIHYLKKAEEYLSSNHHFSYSVPVYKSLSNYFKEVGLLVEAMHYHSLYLSALKSRVDFTERLSNRLVQDRLAEKKENRKKNIVLYGVSGSLVVLVLLLSIRLGIVRRKSKQRYADFVQKTRSNPSSLNTNIKRAPLKSIAKNSESFLMSIETEERLLKELEKLEGENFFLQKDISLASLAAQLKSNSKYVSYLINERKGKDFSSYVNELRIQFVVYKFQNDPQYLKIKLASISDQCGFSSPSKFAAVFKSVTGLSPSSFIFQIKQEKKK